MVPALISVGGGLLLAAVFIGLSCPRIRHAGDKILWTLVIGIAGWIGWCVTAGAIWGWSGVAWAFLGTPIALGFTLLAFVLCPAWPKKK